jgi:hypothetical protein
MAHCRSILRAAPFLLVGLLSGCIPPAFFNPGAAETAAKPAPPMHRNVAQTPGEKTWDAMDQCLREATRNAAGARACKTALRKVILTAPIVDIRANSYYVDLTLSISESQYEARRIICGLDVRKHDERAARLKPGDRVSFRGVLANRLESAYFTDLILRPCVLEPAAPQKPAVR